MATPSEVLDEDIKELKIEIRENRTKIDLVKDEVYRFGLALREMKLELRDEINRLALAQVQMKTELRDEINRLAITLAEMKADFRFVKLLLTIVIMGIAGSVWEFFRLEARVNVMESRLDKMDSRLDKMDSRLERLETSIAKILEQTKPALPAPTPKS
jgi:chromosome segregation ATPase